MAARGRCIGWQGVSRSMTTRGAEVRMKMVEFRGRGMRSSEDEGRGFVETGNELGPNQENTPNHTSRTRVPVFFPPLPIPFDPANHVGR